MPLDDKSATSYLTTTGKDISLKKETKFMSLISGEYFYN
jgi:hypothetical protein